MVEQGRHPLADRMPIGLIVPARIARWLGTKGEGVQDAVEAVLRQWVRRGGRLPAPAARVPPEDAFRTTIRLSGEIGAAVRRASEAAGIAPSTVVHGVLARAAGEKRTVRFSAETPRHSEGRAARLVVVCLDAADLKVLDEVREEGPRSEVLNALLDAWIEADCPVLRDERARRGPRGKRRKAIGSTISLEHADALRRGCLAAGMVPGAALRALVHGLAEVARDSGNWPGFGEAARRAVRKAKLSEATSGE